MKRVLLVGLEYAGNEIDGAEIETLGLGRPEIVKEQAAYSLYEYDVIIINPQSYSHFIFGTETDHSNEDFELTKLKGENEKYDIDGVFDSLDRRNELTAAIESGATVVWCMSDPQRQNFYGYRTTHMGYVNGDVESALKMADLKIKKSRHIGEVDADCQFHNYFISLKDSGWSMCLSDDPKGLTTHGRTPEGYSLGGYFTGESAKGWILTPPQNQASTDILICDAISIEKGDMNKEKYHSIFLSHTGDDKPFVRKLRNDLMGHGVEQVWIDEAEIEIGDSLTAKIAEGMEMSRFIAVALSGKSIDAPWVKKELDMAINREIDGGEVVVLPLLIEDCEIPDFLKGKLYANFTTPEKYEESLNKLLRRLRIKA